MDIDNIIKDILIGSFWSLVITLGAIGIGAAFLKTIKKDNSALWIKACVGISLFIVISSYLDYLSLATRLNLVIFILLGAGYWAVSNGPKELYNLFKSRGFISILLLLPTIYLIILHSMAFTVNANWDDSCGYWPVVHQMSVTGQSWAPLSLRRSLSWGGQYPLQLLGMTFNLQLGGFIYDRAVGTWICLLAVLSVGSCSKKHKVVTAIASVLLLILPVTTTNSAPAVLIAMLIACLYIIRSQAILFALLTSSLILLRTQMVIPCFLIGLITATEYIKQGQIKSLLRFSTLVVGIGIICCLPSMLLHFTMFKTPSVFWDHGTINKAYISFIGHREYLADNLLRLGLTATSILGVMIAGIIFKLNRGAWLVSLLTILAYTISMPEYSELEWVRYSWPMICGATLITFINNWNSNNWKIILVILFGLIGTTGINMFKIHQKNIIGFKTEASGYWRSGDFIKTQTLIPRGRAIAYIGHSASLLNYSRNRIYNWDSYPAVGNPPKDNNPQAWKSWAKSQGIDYLLIENFELTKENGKKRLTAWTGMLGDGSNLKHYERVWIPDREKGFRTLIELKNTLPYYRIGELVIVDLRETPSYELNLPFHQIDEANNEFKELESLEKEGETLIVDHNKKLKILLEKQRESENKRREEREKNFKKDV